MPSSRAGTAIWPNPARPKAALARLHAQLAARHPALAARIAELGAEAGGNRPAEFGAMVHAQVAGVRPLVRELRMQIE